MMLFEHAPLRQKLTSLVMICSVVALLTTAVALGVYERIFYRRVIYTQLQTLTTVTARNSAAAVAFGDVEDATRVLTALAAEPVITAAALYDSAGAKLAQYLRPGETELIPE